MYKTGQLLHVPLVRVIDVVVEFAITGLVLHVFLKSMCILLCTVQDLEDTCIGTQYV